MSFGGMQLLPSYRNKADVRFLQYYRANFKSDRMIYGHWPVECLYSDDGHYHRVVTEKDGLVTVYNNTPCGEDMYDHTWGRNSNSCALALGGFSGAQTDNLGSQCATPEMLDRFCEVLAETCCNLKAPVSNFMSHGEAADNVDQGANPPYDTPGLSGADASPYGPMSTWERWDLHTWVDPHTRKLIPPKGITIPHSAIYLPDYIRGTAFLYIQTMTKAHWAV